MKQYKAIFFDWDGTAVASRSASADELLPRLSRLLAQDVLLIVISGTTYGNVAQGLLYDRLPESQRHNLFMGLGRGAYNYGYVDGAVSILHEITPDLPTRLKIDKVAFDIHAHLLGQYQYRTDIVFSRPNYCKIDLLSEVDRGDSLHFQPGELDLVNRNLERHSYQGGVRRLIDEAIEVASGAGLSLQATTDAKYLEIGMATKAHNVDWMYENVVFDRGISIKECCFWGDEFMFLGQGVRGSDAMMITDKTRQADFFDVSEDPGPLPPEVQHVGGSVSRFLEFLDTQGAAQPNQPELDRNE